MAGDGRVFPASRLTVNRDVFRAPDCIGGGCRTALFPACRAMAQPDPDWLIARLDPDGAAARYSLWTGDAGLAIYLWHCISGEPHFPTVDVL